MKIKEQMKLELMDYKELERQSEGQMRTGKMMLLVAEILLKEVVLNIRRLGGKTNEEENEDHKDKTATETTEV